MQVLGSFARWATLTLATAASACSVAVDSERGADQASTTRAVVAITRSAPAGAPEEARAEAFAGFLRTPVGANTKGALAVAGLGLDLPAVGDCRKGARADAAAPAGLTAVQLLEAGEVTVAAGSSVTTLAPRAFPTITDSISGVVYTTRDRAAAPLPGAASYTVAASGSSTLESLSGYGQAPALLADVTLGGEPAAALESLPAHRDLGLTWAAGTRGDRVYVEVLAGSEPTLCTFADETGHGTLPASALPAQGSANIGVHRLRESAFSDAGLAESTLRFDFELTATVTFE